MIDWEDVGIVIAYSLLGLVIVGGIVGIFALQFAYILSQPVGLTYHQKWGRAIRPPVDNYLRELFYEAENYALKTFHCPSPMLE